MNPSPARLRAGEPCIVARSTYMRIQNSDHDPDHSVAIARITIS